MSMGAALSLLLLGTAHSSPIGEAWVRLDSPVQAAQMRALGAGFAEGRQASPGGDWVRIHGSEAVLDALAEAGFTLRERRADHRQAPPIAGGGYHTPAEMAARLESLAAEHPDRARLVQLGESLAGQPILGLHLGLEGGGPSWRVLGTHHGDELSSAELSLAVAEALLADDPRMPGGLLDEAEVWIVPHVNPDGVSLGSRYNARDIDLNRNYSFQWNAFEYQSGGGPFSEPEARAVRALSLLEPFHAGLSLHSGAENIGYLWNYTTDDTIEESRLRTMAERYQGACDLESFWSTNGADWYITYGDTNDWSYGMRGTLDFTLEISQTKTPAEADLGAFLDAHLPAVGDFLATPVRLRGVVTSTSGLPVEALVRVPGAVDPFPTDPDSGAFARILEPGRYRLIVEAPGFAPASLVLNLGQDSVLRAITLEAAGLAPIRGVPGILSRGVEVVELFLPGLDPPPDFITLWRPGADSISVDLQGTTYPIPTADLVPGPYSVLWEGGAAPRAVFAGNDTDRVRVDAVEDRGETLEIRGQGFAVGARAWGIWGSERALRPLAMRALGGDQLTLDAGALPRDEPVDVVLATNGAEVTILDALGEPGLDTAAPEDPGPLDLEVWGDTADADLDTIALEPVCGGCDSTPAAPWLLPALLGLAVRRRT